MSRSQARIYVSCWHDEDFTDLAIAEQHAYFMLLSQHTVTFAGVQPINWPAWSTLSRGSSVSALRKAVAALAMKRFVLLDETTGEVWIRTFVKHDGIMASPNLIVSMTRDFGFIRSQKIRGSVLDQLGEGFLEGLPKGLQQRLGEPFRRQFLERFPLVCAHGAEPLPPPKAFSPPPPPQPATLTATSGPAHANGNGGGGSTTSSEKPPHELIAAAIRSIAAQQLVDALAADRREPIRNQTAWLEKARANLETTAAGDIAEAWALTGGVPDGDALADAVAHLPALRADAVAQATRRALDTEAARINAAPLVKSGAARALLAPTEGDQ